MFVLIFVFIVEGYAFKIVDFVVLQICLRGGVKKKR